MSVEKQKIYTARNKEGYLCCYDVDTHKCVGVMDSTGDTPLTLEKRKTFIGQVDPKFNQKQ